MKSKYLYCVGKENIVNNYCNHNYYDCLCLKGAIKAIKKPPLYCLTSAAFL